MSRAIEIGAIWNICPSEIGWACACGKGRVLCIAIYRAGEIVCAIWTRVGIDEIFAREKKRIFAIEFGGRI